MPRAARPRAIPHRPSSVRRRSGACRRGAWGRIRLKIRRRSRSSLRLRSIRPRIDERDRPGLLADDHDQGVGLLADPDRGPMAGAVALAVEHVLAEREQDAGGQDLSPRDDHRPVVERGAVIEDASRAARRGDRRGSGTPDSAVRSARPVSRSITISAPWRDPASRRAAREISRATGVGRGDLVRHEESVQRSDPTDLLERRAAARAGRRPRPRTGPPRRPSGAGWRAGRGRATWAAR